MDFNAISCAIIANAGESKSCSMEAIEQAQLGTFNESQRLIQEAFNSLQIAHKEHTKILVNEANASEIKMNFLMVHASNHLSMAELTLDFAKLYIELLKEVKKND